MAFASGHRPRTRSVKIVATSHRTNQKSQSYHPSSCRLVDHWGDMMVETRSTSESGSCQRRCRQRRVSPSCPRRCRQRRVSASRLPKLVGALQDRRRNKRSSVLALGAPKGSWGVSKIPFSRRPNKCQQILLRTSWPSKHHLWSDACEKCGIDGSSGLSQARPGTG